MRLKIRRINNVARIFAVTALFLIGTGANAQFGKKLKGMAKKKIIKDKSNNTSSASDNKNETIKSKSKNTSSISDNGTKTLELDYNTFKFTPAVTLSSLLYGTNIYKTGTTRLSSYTASFVPYKKMDGTLVSPTGDQGEYLKIKVYKGEEFVDYFEYDGSSTFYNNKLRKFNKPSNRYQKNGEWASGSNVDLKKWGEGNYRLEFYAGAKLFYNFDFEVYKVTNDDAYADLSEMYLSRGAWNKYAWMEEQKSGNMVFGFYLQHEEFKPNTDPNKTSKDVSWTLNITKNGKPFATHYDKRKPKKGKVKRAEWTEMSTAMKTADATKVIQLTDFTDGAYKIEVKVDNEATPRIYKFNVSNNKIVLIDEQDRSKNTDPTRLIEGWDNFYWFKLKE